MARPKKSEPKGVPIAPTKRPKGFVLSVRGSEEWRAWLQQLADHDRSGIPDVIDRALAKYAKDTGFKVPPPKR